MTKPFLYLVQSSSERLPLARPLVDGRPSADALYATYDKPAEGAAFLPGSTWGEGRNYLAGQARARPGYAYYIFIDDDIAFAKGNFDRFEALLLRYRPAFACPVFIPKTLHTVMGAGGGLLRPPFRCLRAQPLRLGDGQCTAVHPSVLRDGLLFPLQTRFDRLSWWCTSLTLQILAHNLYGNHALQFNPVAVLNLAHRPYNRALDFPEYEAWLRDQFVRPPERPGRYVACPFSLDGLARFRKVLGNPVPRKDRLFTTWLGVLAGALACRPRHDYAFTPASLARLVRPDSDLYRQFLEQSVL